MMPHRIETLAELIAPEDEHIFRTQFWEQDRLLIQGRKPDFFDDLFSLGLVDDWISSGSLAPSQVRIVKDGELLPITSNTGLDASFPAKIYDQYRDGATINLIAIQDRWPPLSALCRALSQEFSACFRAGAYLTPPASRGLAKHHDTHSVLVLQIAGKKMWRIYDGAIRLPLEGQHYDSSTMEAGPLVEEFDLAPGDMVYIPRGYLHEAESYDTLSLHITIAVKTLTWSDLLLRAVAANSERDARFRASVPKEFYFGSDNLDEMSAQLEALISAMSDPSSLEQVIDAASKEISLGTRPSLDGYLLDSLHVRDLVLTDSVLVRRDIKWVWLDDSERIELFFHGKTVSLPLSCRSALAYMLLQEKPFPVSELPDDLDDDGKLTLIRRLVSEGLLTVQSTEQE